MNDELFRKRLKELRESRGMSQKLLCELSGIDRSSISKYENGMRRPSVDAIVILARIFKVDVNYMMGLADKIVIQVDDYITYEKIMKILNDEK